MRIEHLRDLDHLFDHRGDALILLCLAERPMRFSELATAIVAESGARMADGKLTRSLPRLTQNNLIDVDDTDGRHPVYRLSREGQRKAALLAFILTAMDNHQDLSETADDASR